MPLLDAAGPLDQPLLQVPQARLPHLRRVLRAEGSASGPPANGGGGTFKTHGIQETNLSHSSLLEYP